MSLPFLKGIEEKMAKKNKKVSDYSNNNSYSAVPMPVPVSMDSLAVYTDGDIRARAELMETEMARAIKHGMDAYPWQVELAYLQREYDIRRARIAAHDRYVRTNPEYIVTPAHEDQLPN